MRDTGWVDGQRAVGPFGLDAHEHRAAWRAHVWFSNETRLIRVGESMDAPDEATARRAAEDALRSLCRDVLAALDAPHSECPDCDGVGGFSAHGKPSGAVVRPCLTCDGQRTVAALGDDR